MAEPAGTLGRSLLRFIDHGPKRVRAADNKRASRAGASLVAWGGRHCPAVRDKLLTQQVESSLRNGLTSAKGLSVDSDSYVAVTPTALDAAEPTLHFTAGPTTPGDVRSVSVHVQDVTDIVMAASTGRACFYIADDPTGVGTQFARWSSRRATPR